jgi:phage-related protein
MSMAVVKNYAAQGMNDFNSYSTTEVVDEQVQTEIERAKDVFSDAITLASEITDVVNRIVGTPPEDKNSAVGPTPIPNGILEDLGASASAAGRSIRTAMESMRRLKRAF